MARELSAALAQRHAQPGMGGRALDAKFELRLQGAVSDKPRASAGHGMNYEREAGWVPSV